MSTEDDWMKGATAKPQSRGRRIGGWLLALLSGGVILSLVLFSAVFLYFLLPEIYLNFQGARWNPATCTILSARVAKRESLADAGKMLYRVNVRYAYEFGKERHESTRHRFVDHWANKQSVVERTVDSYRPGSMVPCYVNPADPGQAVLDRSLSPFILYAPLLAAIVVLGLRQLRPTMRRFIRL